MCITKYLLLLLVFAPLCHSNGIQLSLQTGKENYVVGEPIYVDVQIMNNSSKFLSFDKLNIDNKRFDFCNNITNRCKKIPIMTSDKENIYIPFNLDKNKSIRMIGSLSVPIINYLRFDGADTLSDLQLFLKYSPDSKKKLDTVYSKTINLSIRKPNQKESVFLSKFNEIGGIWYSDNGVPARALKLFNDNSNEYYKLAKLLNQYIETPYAPYLYSYLISTDVIKDLKIGEENWNNYIKIMKSINFSDFKSYDPYLEVHHYYYTGHILNTNLSRNKSFVDYRTEIAKNNQIINKKMHENKNTVLHKNMLFDDSFLVLTHTKKNKKWIKKDFK